MPSRNVRLLVLAAFAVIVSVAAGAAQSRVTANAYSVNPLVSDSSATAAPATDASLVNGWGLSAGPTTPWWSANNEQQGGKRRLVRPDKGNEKPPASAQHDPIPVALREPATSGIKTRIESGKDNVFDYDIK